MTFAKAGSLQSALNGKSQALSVAARRWHQVQTHPKGREKRHKKREDYSGHQNGGPLRYLRGGRELCNFGCLFRLQTSAQKFSPERLASNHKSALLYSRLCPLFFRADTDGERTTTDLGEFDKTSKSVRSGGGLSDGQSLALWSTSHGFLSVL